MGEVSVGMVFGIKSVVMQRQGAQSVQARPRGPAFRRDYLTVSGTAGPGTVAAAQRQ